MMNTMRDVTVTNVNMRIFAMNIAMAPTALQPSNDIMKRINSLPQPKMHILFLYPTTTVRLTSSLSIDSMKGKE